MKNNTLIIFAIGIVSLIGVGLYLYTKQTSTTENVVISESSTVAEVAPILAQPSMGTPSAEYVPFTPDSVSDTSGTRVLFFYANWCPTCKAAEEDIIQNLSQLPSDLKIIRVNYNDTDTDQTEKDLAKRYGVTYQHTFVQIDAQGSVVSIWNGGGVAELLDTVE